MEKKYYLIYCRKSSRPEDRQAASLPRQLRECQDLVERLKLEVIGEPIIESGTAWIDSDRDAFQAMIQLIDSRNDIKGIIAFDSDRLARNGKDNADLTRLLMREKITHILTCQGEIFDTNSTMMMGIKNVFGNEYSFKISKNVRASMKDRTSQGIPPYTPKLGYISDPDAPKGQKKPIPHSVYFPIFRKVMELFMNGSYSVASITKEANNLGLRNPRGRVISKSRMHQMLRDPYYKGEFLFHGDTHIGNYQALLTPEEFDLIQEILSGRSRPHRLGRNLLLSGLIRCGECTHAVCGEVHKKTYVSGKQAEFIDYRCSNNKCSQKKYYSQSALEAQVIDFLKTIELDPEWVEFGKKYALEMSLESQGISANARQARQSAHDSITKRIANLIKTKSEMGDAFDNEEFKKSLDSLVLEKKSIERQIATVEQQFDDSLHWTIKTFEFAASARRKFAEGSLTDKKTILQAVNSNLTLKDGLLAIQPSQPFNYIIENSKQALPQMYRLEPNTIANIQPLLTSLDIPRPGLRPLLDETRTWWMANSIEQIRMKTLLA